MDETSSVQKQEENIVEPQEEKVDLKVKPPIRRGLKKITNEKKSLVIFVGVFLTLYVFLFLLLLIRLSNKQSTSQENPVTPITSETGTTLSPTKATTSTPLKKIFKNEKHGYSITYSTKIFSLPETINEDSLEIIVKNDEDTKKTVVYIFVRDNPNNLKISDWIKSQNEFLYSGANLSQFTIYRDSLDWLIFPQDKQVLSLSPSTVIERVGYYENKIVMFGTTGELNTSLLYDLTQGLNISSNYDWSERYRSESFTTDFPTNYPAFPGFSKKIVDNYTLFSSPSTTPTILYTDLISNELKQIESPGSQLLYTKPLATVENTSTNEEESAPEKYFEFEFWDRGWSETRETDKFRFSTGHGDGFYLSSHGYIGYKDGILRKATIISATVEQTPDDNPTELNCPCESQYFVFVSNPISLSQLSNN